MGNEDITPGELSRRLDRFEVGINRRLDEARGETNRRLSEIRDELRDMAFVHKDVYLENQKHIWAAIGEINEKDKRRIAWIATGILLPVLLIVVLQLLQLQ